MSKRTALVVYGSRDLLMTALVTALGAYGFEVIGSLTSAGHPGLLLVDLDVPGRISLVRRAVSGGWRVIGLTGGELTGAAAVAAGAASFFPKSDSLRELADLLRAVADGREVLDATERERLRSAHLAAERERQRWADRLERLSPREREVLALLEEGLRAADVAERLFLSIATVRTHIQNMLSKLEVSTQERAVEIYRTLTTP